MEDLTAVKRIVVQNVTPGKGIAVLNAADPFVAGMAAHCPGSVTFFARDPDNPVITRHRAQGKRVIYLDGERIVASEDGVEYRVPLAGSRLRRMATIAFQIENAMAALGRAGRLAWIGK